MMKVLHISTEAAKHYAYVRLHESLLKLGVDSKFLVLGKKGELEEVYTLENNSLNKVKGVLKYRISQKKLSKENILYDSPFSTGDTGYLLADNPLIKEADIIHIHWISNILSIDSIRQLIKMNKVIVWTCHDSWAFTGGCYVRYGCTNFQRECGTCPELNSNKKKDLSYCVFQKKKRAWMRNGITLVAPSNWMKNNILSSSIFCHNRVVVIPNALDTDIYKKGNDAAEKQKVNILFGAAEPEVPYKGFDYLIQMLQEMLNSDSEAAKKYCLHFVGTDGISNPILNQFECKFWGFVSEQKDMARIYSAADVFICPSLDDNLPGMVMESMSCETPVVAFATGGIPNMVEHKKNGYLAEYKNAGDLAEGLKWVLENNKEGEIGIKAREKVLKNYSQEIVAKKHLELYRSILVEGKK